MDLNYSAEELAFRDEVSAWLRDNLPADLRDKVTHYRSLSRDDLLRWHKILAAKGWVAPAWPEEWGGTGWNVVQRYIFEEACGYAGTPPLIPFGLTMCAPVLLNFGTDAQKQRFLPRIYNGEDFWCQGYSEPGSGSDLASLKTRAVRKGDHYVVNGQKTWTTLAHMADWIFCLVRTDPGLEAQAGRHLVPAHRHEDAGHHGAPADPDGRRARSQRSVLRRRQGAGREPGLRRRQGLDGRQVPARPRAHEHRAHRRLAARAGKPQGIRGEAAARTASRCSTIRAFATSCRASRSS